MLCTLSKPWGFSALWGLRVLPDKLWCSLGIACDGYQQLLITLLKRETVTLWPVYIVRNFVIRFSSFPMIWEQYL